MSNGNGTIWIVFNGEIYNFLELKKELQALGHSFQSSSDTEVIIKVYQQWGEEAFDKLNGMFALALYDGNKEFIYLIRDHIGIKPLYYCFSENQVIFASEIKAFKALNSNWEMNPDWKIQFLAFGFIPEPHTYLKDVYALPKASVLRLELNYRRHAFNRYSNLIFKDDIKDLNKAKALLRGSFRKAVKRHLVSDAPIGVFLSGGIDSSLIAGIASGFRDKLNTLSIIFDEKEFTEEYYQQVIAKKINSNHSFHKITGPDFLNCVDDIFKAMDQPTIDGINTYFISKCAKEAGLKTVLSGIGGDELFGGYPSFNRIDKIWHLKHFGVKFKRIFSAGEYLYGDKYKKAAFLSLAYPLSFYLFFRGLFTPDTISKILGCTVSDIHCALAKVKLSDPLPFGRKNFVSHMETDFYMSNQLLRDTDFMSMWHSIEARVPFLDKELMSLVLSIAEKIKFNDQQYKFLLVESFKDILPNEIIYREKAGFTFPFQRWMNGNISFFSEMIINRNKTVNKLIEKFKNDEVGWGKYWALVVLNKMG